MQSALRIGRFGPLTIHLNYTWLFAAVLILWWTALSWLPERFPDWSNRVQWLVAIVVLLLFVLSVIIHEFVHTLLAGTGARQVNLFPFGAAVPIRAGQVPPGRAIISALGGAAFNLMLGGLLVWLGSLMGDAEGFTAYIKGVIVPLGILNLALGGVNLIPGIPFDGGWALAATISFFNNDREGGRNIARTLGGFASVALVLLGAWRGLLENSWLESLALIVVGWAAREAVMVGQQRSTLRLLLEQMKARDFMEPVRESDSVDANTTVAGMVAAHQRTPPNIPLPVLDEAQSLIGVTTLGASDRLLQGTWATTPVRALTVPLDKLHVVSPDSPITSVMLIAQEQARAQSGLQDEAELATLTSPDDEDDAYIPVIENGKLVGSINPVTLAAFEDAGRQFGIEESVAAMKPKGIMALLGAAIPILAVIAAMAILGSIALRTDPTKLPDVIDNDSDSITLSNYDPADNDFIGLGSREISVEVSAASAIISATLSIDNQPLETQMTGASPLTQTVSATMPGLTLGSHTARVEITTQDGGTANDSWEFRVSSSFQEPTPTAEPTPVPTPAAQRFEVANYNPVLGGRVPAGADDVNIGFEVETEGEFNSAQVMLDGQELQASVEPIAGAENRYRVSAPAPNIGVGQHRVTAVLSGSGGGSHTSEWTFTALQPNENNAYFKETGYFLSQPFLRYWQENGGLAQFGYPISDLIQEKVEGTNETYLTQYFERARFEQHSSLGDQVILGRLGALLTEPEPAAQPREGYTFVPETGHNVSPVFLKYWQENGGLAIFGFPITEERTEKNPIDGKEYTVQYFERNRFELHPDKAGTPFEVQLGLLGAQLYKQNYEK